MQIARSQQGNSKMVPTLIKEVSAADSNWRYNNSWEYETDVEKGLYGFAHEEHPEEMYVKQVFEDFRPVIKFIDPFAGEEVLQIFPENFDDLCAFEGEDAAIDALIEVVNTYCWDDSGQYQVEDWKLDYLRGEGELPIANTAE